MKIEFWCINKTSFQYVKDGIAEYEKRLKHYVKLNIAIIPNIKNTKNLTAEQLKYAEAKLVTSKLDDSDHLVLLDEKGKQLTSCAFSLFIEGCRMANHKRVVFLIGGGYGFDQSLYERAGATLALSKMTFPHELVRVIFLEQLYRAFTILKGEKYHHE